MKLNEVLNPVRKSQEYSIRKEDILSEGITHIEDASMEEFLHTVENLAKMTVTEKLDGANMWFGINDNGEFYTARGSHKGGGEEFKSPGDWQTVFGGKNAFAANGFGSAHQALSKVQGKIKEVLQPGEAVEVEILYGTTPNAVAYDGKNYIAMLRVVEGPPSRIKELDALIKGKKAVVNSSLITTTDGVEIKRQKVPVEWTFTSTQFIESHHLENVNVQTEISKLKAYLKTPAKSFPQYNNLEVLSLPLTAIPKESRSRFKEIKAMVHDHVMEKYKLPIKEKLLDQFVRKLGPKLGKSAEEGGWIEGVVILDPNTKRQLKIVDKDVFTTVNSFNWQVRAAVSAKVAGAKQLNVSLMGDYFQKLGKIFGVPNLFIAAQQGRILKKLGGKNAEETLSHLVTSLPEGGDLSKYKGRLSTLMRNKVKEIDKMLNKYKDDRDKLILHVNKGDSNKKFNYDKDIDERTLQVFAEMRADIIKANEVVKRAHSTAEILAVLLHNRLRVIHG